VRYLFRFVCPERFSQYDHGPFTFDLATDPRASMLDCPVPAPRRRCEETKYVGFSRSGFCCNYVSPGPRKTECLLQSGFPRGKPIQLEVCGINSKLRFASLGPGRKSRSNDHLGSKRAGLRTEYGRTPDSRAALL
jgi:hypothetical protein